MAKRNHRRLVPDLQRKWRALPDAGPERQRNRIGPEPCGSPEITGSFPLRIEDDFLRLQAKEQGDFALIATYFVIKPFKYVKSDTSSHAGLAAICGYNRLILWRLASPPGSRKTQTNRPVFDFVLASHLLFRYT